MHFHMSSPAFITKSKRPTSTSEKKAETSRSVVPPRPSTLPSLSKHLRRTMSLTRQLKPDTRTQSSTPIPPTILEVSPISHTKSLPDASPRVSKMNLRALFSGRSRKLLPRRHTIAVEDPTLEDDGEGSSEDGPIDILKSPRLQAKDGQEMEVVVLRIEEGPIRAHYTPMGPMHEEEPLDVDALFPIRDCENEEDPSETEEEDMSLMRELILGRIELRL